MSEAKSSESDLNVLLPCPFCSGSASWCDCDIDPDAKHEGCHQITCHNCGNFDFANGHLDGDGETLKDLRECMADKWNARCR